MSDKAESIVNPPWIEYPGSDPIWGGWRQGYSEAWLLNVFLPFWRGLSPEDRKHYLETWPPPGDDWNYYLSVLWIK